MEVAAAEAAGLEGGRAAGINPLQLVALLEGFLRAYSSRAGGAWAWAVAAGGRAQLQPHVAVAVAVALGGGGALPACQPRRHPHLVGLHASLHRGGGK